MASIFLQHVDGKVESIAVSPGTSTRKVILGHAPRLPLVTDQAKIARTVFAIGSTGLATKEFLVQEKERANKYTVRFRAINYDERYYLNDGDAASEGASEDTYPWADPIPTPTIPNPASPSVVWSKVPIPFVNAGDYLTLPDGTQLVTAQGAYLAVPQPLNIDQTKVLWRKPPGGTWSCVFEHPDWLKGESIVQNPSTGTIIAPMSSGGQGYVLRSINGGAGWSQALFDPGAGIRFAAYGNGYWVVCGDAAVVYVSADDGLTWTKVHEYTGGNYQFCHGIIYDGTQFVYRQFDKLVSSSTPMDANSWVDHLGLPGWSSIFQTFAFLNGKYAAIGRGANPWDPLIYVSPSLNGPWIAKEPAPYASDHLVSVGGYFLMTAEGAAGDGFYASPDGETWTWRNIDPNFYPNAMGRLGNDWVYMSDDWGYMWVGTSP